jgi:hypothetical protein
MKLCINTLEVGQCHFLPQDHFVEADNEVSVEESAMEDAQAQATTDELEIVEMLRVDAGCRINLQRIVIVRRVLEQAVEGIEHFVRK